MVWFDVFKDGRMSNRKSITDDNVGDLCSMHLSLEKKQENEIIELFLIDWVFCYDS